MNLESPFASMDVLQKLIKFEELK